MRSLSIPAAIASGWLLASPAPGQDCNGNGVPDDRELSLEVLFQDFDGSPLPPGATTTSSGLWHVGPACRPPGSCGAGDFAYFGVDTNCTFNTGDNESGTYWILGVDLPVAPLELEFCSYYGGEGGDAGDENDLAVVYARPMGAPGSGDLLEFTSGTSNQNAWETRALDLTPYGGQTVDLGFFFNSGDPLFNGYFGWGLDDVRITADFDANGNGVLDECECGATNRCVTSANSAGAGALIGWMGSVGIAANDLVLVTRGLPPGQFGLYYFGPNPAATPFGEGIRCIDPPVQRLPILPTGAGVTTFAFDYTNPAHNPGNHVFAGTTHHFQFWYRDPPGGGAFFNLSDALEITFCR